MSILYETFHQIFVSFRDKYDILVLLILLKGGI